MPGLADLHRHLDGSLRPETVAALATRRGLQVPADLLFKKGMGLRAALAKFSFLVELLQEPAELQRVASEICEDAQRDGVTTLEIRFAPQLHGQSMAAAIDAVLQGIDGRAGLILCGLYGHDPAILEELVRSGSARPEVVGIDLAGGPSAADSWHVSDYVTAFHAAADHGLGRTVHAGEGRPPAEIAFAVDKLLAQRIGHGTTLLEDERVVNLVLEKEITIEACPTSNVHTGVIDSVASHPLGEWLRRGVRVCVCPDNTLLSGVSASAELDGVVALLGLSPEQRQRLVNYGHQAAFVR